MGEVLLVGHTVHSLLPTTFFHVPAAHAVHVPPTGPVYPALHGATQALIDELATSEEVPAGHPRQVVAVVVVVVVEY
jgi:hypothetical protein